MSSVEQVTSNNSFLQEVLPLLQEYGQTLETIREQVNALLEQIRKNLNCKPPLSIDQLDLDKSNLFLLRIYFFNLQGPAIEIAQHISQRITHAELDWSSRVELQLRLAAFEYLLHSTELMIDKVTEYINKNK